MTKADIVAKMAVSADISKVAAEKALNGFIKTLTDELSSGGRVTLVGFGTFSVSDRAAREVMNPQTKQKMNVPATRVAKFKPGAKLKEAVKK